MAYKNIEDQKEYKRKYQQEHKEEHRKSNRKYCQNHKEKIRKYRQTHSERHKTYLVERREEVMDWYNGNVDGLSCPDCGLSFKEVLPSFAQFHHIVKSKYNIITAIQSITYNNVVKEFDKGVFLCPNCHRIRHLHLRKERLCQSLGQTQIK